MIELKARSTQLATERMPPPKAVARKRIIRLDGKTVRLRQQIADRKVLQIPDRAIAGNGGRPLIPWTQAKKQLNRG